MSTATESRRARAGVALVVPESAVFRFSFADSSSSSHPMPTLRAFIAHDMLRAAGLLEPLNAKVDLVYAKCIDLVQSRGWEPPKNKLTDAMIRASGGPTDEHSLELRLHGAGDDNPIGPGVYDYSRAIVVASVTAAYALLDGYETAINWSGGMHHACFEKMAGFCYLNDISAAIEVLLTKFSSVLYVDIDVHHGDGVETDWKGDGRVTTLSIHYFDGQYFPGTGWEPIEIDESSGSIKINLPMAGNLTDHRFTYLMSRVLRKVVAHARPDCIVLQSGADSLAGDPLGLLNLSGLGHASIMTIIKEFKLPTLVLGGGGYNLVNVPRAWAIETAIAAGGLGLPPWSDMIVNACPLVRYIMEGVTDWCPPNFNVADSNSTKSVERLADYLDSVMDADSHDRSKPPAKPARQIEI